MGVEFVELDKAGGILQGYRRIQIARSLGLKTMLARVISSLVACPAWLPSYRPAPPRFHGRSGRTRGRGLFDWSPPSSAQGRAQCAPRGSRVRVAIAREDLEAPANERDVPHTMARDQGSG